MSVDGFFLDGFILYGSSTNLNELMNIYSENVLLDSKNSY